MDKRIWNYEHLVWSMTASCIGQWLLLLVIVMPSEAQTPANRITCNPGSLTTDHPTLVTLQGSAFGDYYQFAVKDVTDCTAIITPSTFVNTNNKVDTFTFSGVGNYLLCYRIQGEMDSVGQTNCIIKVVAGTSATKITVSPTSITEDHPTVLTLTGAQPGDKVGFAAQGVQNCAGVTPSTLISSVNEAITVTLPDVGTVNMCLRDFEGTDSILQTNGLMTVVTPTPTNKITIAPTRTSSDTDTAINFIGAEAGDKFAFSAGGASDCTGVVPNILIPNANAIVTTQVPDTGVLKLCLRDVGGTDSIPQDNGDLTVGATSPTHTTPYPIGFTINMVVTISFSGGGTGDKFAYSSVGASDCVGITPNTDVGADGKGTYILIALGTYQLCYRKAGEFDSRPQTNGVTTVIGPTSTSKITIPSNQYIRAGDPASVTFTGSQTGDMYQWSASGAPDCTGVVPYLNYYNIIPSPNSVESITILATGTHKLCYTDAGGTDTATQTFGSLNVVGSGVGGADPVVIYGDIRRGFVLPPSELFELLRAPDFTLYGETYEGRGDWEQWFKRMVIASRDGSQWLEIAIKPNLMDFNRSKAKARPNDFQSLDVTVGRGKDVHSPEWVQSVPVMDYPIPFGFLGADLKFHVWQPTFISQAIGKARRECLEAAFVNLQFMICSAPASEFSGALADLAIRFAHVDFILLEVDGTDKLHGLFPELWGFQPLSEENAKYVLEPENTTTV